MDATNGMLAQPSQNASKLVTSVELSLVSKARATRRSTNVPQQCEPSEVLGCEHASARPLAQLSEDSGQ